MKLSIQLLRKIGPNTDILEKNKKARPVLFFPLGFRFRSLKVS